MFRKKRIKNLDHLEIDEVFFDNHQISESGFKWEDKISKNISSSAIKKLGLVLLLVFSVVLFRNLYIVIFKNKEYTALAKANYIKEIWDRAPRGIIYDAKGKALVKNALSFNLVMIPAELPRNKEKQENIVKILSELLAQSQDTIKKEFQDINRFSFRPVLVLENLDHSELLAFKSQIENLQGFRLEENFKREYEGKGVYSHVLGYTGRVTEKDIKRKNDFLLTDIIGKNGAEFQYESFLRGQNGVTMLESYAHGGTGRVVGNKQAVAGNNLNLFLDADLQSKLTEVMSRHLGAIGLSRAAAIAIDPRGGGVLALQSFPLFDSNVFTTRLSPETFKNLFESNSQPMFNRVIGGVYPPGSTVKPFIGIGALQEKIVTDKTLINDKGFITVGNQIFKGWKVLGIVDIYKAIAMSSNIFFYTVGGGYGDIPGLGPEKLAEYYKLFGFSKLTGIDLPGEADGFIPTPNWKRLNKREGWFSGDTYNMSIGQGFVQSTPLQLALATSAIANHGTLFKPRVVKNITDASGKVIKNIEPEILSKNFVDQESLEIIRKAMHETIVSGSGRSLSSLAGSAGGKTGTAQTGVGNNTHAWFSVFAPYENPEIVLIVLVENGGEGSSIAAPIAREVLEWYMNR
ncbi:MAG: penicillin-binding protein 2 [bacterium]|nr:penicillin-binding protein 2 [bacterium]